MVDGNPSLRLLTAQPKLAAHAGFLIAAILWTSTAAAQPAAPELAKPRVVGIDWPEMGAISVSSGAMDRLAGVDETLLPVLVPRPFLTFKSLKFVGEPLQYSVSVQAVGATLAITGTRIAIDAGTDPAPSTADGVRILLGEKTAEANTNRYGAAYSVTVECEKDGDDRCNDGEYVTNLVRSLELVGGGRETAPPLPPRTPPLPSTIPVSGDPNFEAKPAGELLPGSGNGVRTATIYAPGIRFPVSTKPVYLNSQVWNVGGTHGSPGGWSDPRNYRYPWRDNFCERRHWRTPMCPSGTGHQGVDIRPGTAKNLNRQMAVAVESGRILKIGSFSVTLAGDSGTQYNYLHLGNLEVSVGERVTAGEAIGLISNNFGKDKNGRPAKTTYHLHFEIKQNRNGTGWVHVPPYSSLVAAYERL